MEKTINATHPHKVVVIGAGLAGSEAAFYLAGKGIRVTLVECKRLQLNPAQKIKTFAELVCTNSLKSVQEDTPHGLLKTEMRALGSLVLTCAEQTSVPAGDALAVDRVLFSEMITAKLQAHPLIEIKDEDVSDPIALMTREGASLVVVATGPLTTSPLEKWIQNNLSSEDFYFYDAIAPVVAADSLDTSQLYFKDRHRETNHEGAADYLNAPMNKEQYEIFVQALIDGEKVPPKDFEEMIYFESCLPIETMAERGKETPRFSCMKPIGLEKAPGEMPYAVVQLRRENLLGEAFNLVGFQTRLTYKEQLRIFRMIPGFENAQFLHLGSVHRNSFLNARRLLDFDLRSKQFPQLYFAGQMTGVEGYTESAMSGLYVAWQIERRLLQNIDTPLVWPVETATGALIHYLMTSENPRPSNINGGLFPPVTMSREERKGMRKTGDRKKWKRVKLRERASDSFKQFLLSNHQEAQL